MKKFFTALFLFIISLQITGCAGSTQPVQKTGFYFDTVISVTIYGMDDSAVFSSEKADAAINDSFGLCSYYEGLFSNTISSSDISRINAADGKKVQVSADTVDILEDAVKYSELTAGAFDVTISPVSSLWDFRSGDGAVPPADSDIKEALRHVGYENIQIDGSMVWLNDPDAAIDLGGIAKGYIADRLRDFLKTRGVTSAVINLGGNVLTVGEKTDGSEFNIGIQKPFSDTGEILLSVKSDNLSVVSSGPYERYFRYNGKLYHHILNPATGYPVENDLNGVTIITNESVDGDALSTSCFVLGAEKGSRLIESLKDTGAVFINSDNEVIWKNVDVSQ